MRASYGCPHCRKFVGWKRLCATDGVQERWPCVQCGRLLRFSIARRIISTCCTVAFMIGIYEFYQKYPAAKVMPKTEWLYFVLLFLALYGSVMGSTLFNKILPADESDAHTVEETTDPRA